MATRKGKNKKHQKDDDILEKLKDLFFCQKLHLM